MRIALGDFFCKISKKICSRGMTKDKQVDQYYKNESLKRVEKNVGVFIKKYSVMVILEVEKMTPFLTGFVIYKMEKLKELV